MKGVCAIVIDDDRVFISLGSLKKTSFRFLEEFSLSLAKKPTDLPSCIRENSGLLNQAIEDAERRYSLKVDKIFIELPAESLNTKKVTDIIPLKGKKRVSSFDLSFIKKYLEDKYLDWDDFCLHNIAFNYTVLDSVYSEPPYGVWAKKLGGKFLLASVKEKVYKDIEDIFDNFNRQFCGFVSSALSTYASVFTKPLALGVVLRFDYSTSNFLIRTNDDLIFSKKIDFSFRGLIEKISKRFLLDYSLAEEVFERYVSFKETPYFKEITIKKDSGYVNLSIQTINLFVKDYLRSEILNILQLIREQVDSSDFIHSPEDQACQGRDRWSFGSGFRSTKRNPEIEDTTPAKPGSFIFSFIGRLGKKEGFYNFLRECYRGDFSSPPEQSAVSTASGCLRYGLSPFFEIDYKKGRSFLQYIRDVYSEYF